MQHHDAKDFNIYLKHWIELCTVL